jgi:hypothetical protein
MTYTIDFDSPEVARAAVKTEMPEFNERALFSPAVYSETTTDFRVQESAQVRPGADQASSRK